jgi:3-oxoacyl-[acyl-carrier-protein] synthase III
MPPVEIGAIDGVGVRGGGTAFPGRELGNEEALRLIGLRGSADHLRSVAGHVASTIGVERRAWAHAPGTPLDPARDETTLDLALAAGRAALDDAGIAPADVSLVLCATSTPDRSGATVAGGVGAALGTRGACLDIRGGCAAGLFGLATAALHVHAGCGPVLLVGAETFSRVIPADHQLAALALADGAGAIVLARGRGRLRGAVLRTDGTLAHLLPDASPPTVGDLALAAGAYFLSGAPEELTDEIPRRYGEAVAGILQRAGVAARDIELLILHQASRPLLEAALRQSGLPAERAFTNLERHANLGAAGWLVALVEARAQGRVPPGTRVALAAVGGALSWAAAVLEC